MRVRHRRMRRAGLERLREAHGEGDPFDIAIVDMKMPGMDGLELAAAVRADPALAGSCGSCS